MPDWSSILVNKILFILLTIGVRSCVVGDREVHYHLHYPEEVRRQYQKGPLGYTQFPLR